MIDDLMHDCLCLWPYVCRPAQVAPASADDDEEEEGDEAREAGKGEEEGQGGGWERRGGRVGEMGRPDPW